LYKAGYKTLQSIAKADPREIKETIPYLNYKIIAQIIAAAKVNHIIYTYKNFVLLLIMKNYSFYYCKEQKI